MTPQELINLPYAGMAEKQLRKQGDWQLTPQEELRKLSDAAYIAVDDVLSNLSAAQSKIEKMENLTWN